MPYQDDMDELAELESFDAGAFSGDEDVPPDICSFILALALIYNDFRDVIQAHRLLSQVAPAAGPSVTPSWGQYSAHQTSLMRLHVGVLHELLELVGRKPELLDHEAFTRIVRSMNDKGRKAWAAICDVALTKKSEHPLAKALVRVRNKIAFHYDASEIFRGYSQLFLRRENISAAASEEPLASRGDKVLRVRFYFADAAVQKYLYEFAEDALMKELLGDGTLNQDVAEALTGIVAKFVDSRTGWRAPTKVSHAAAPDAEE